MIIGSTGFVWSSQKLAQNKTIENQKGILEGFLPTVQALGINVADVDIFNNYLTWTKTASSRGNDKLLSALYHLSYFEPTAIRSSTNQKYSLVDINGDALPDVLYHDQFYDGSVSNHYLALFLNQGGTNFTLVYKCVRDDTVSNRGFYGDCAGTGGSNYIPLVADDSLVPSSQAPKSNDIMMRVLYRLAYFHSDDVNGLKKTPQKTSFVDINGDGLIDLLYHNYTYSTNNRSYSFGVFLNRGDLGFDVSYRCYIFTSGSTNPTTTYRGDCAG